MKLSEVTGEQPRKLSEITSPTTLTLGGEPAAAAPPGFLAGMGHAVAERGMGLAQAVSHAIGPIPETALIPPEAIGMMPPEQIGAMAKREVTPQSVDEDVRQLQEGYAAKRKAGGPSAATWTGEVLGGFATDMLLTAPLAAVGPGSTILGGIGRGAAVGAAGGAMGGLAQPVTGGNYATEKAKRVGTSTAVGGVVGGALGGLAGALAKDSPEAVDKFIQDNYRRAIKPSVSGKATSSQLERSHSQARSAIDSIVQNRANLKFEEDGRIVAGQLPKTIEQFSDAIEQTKKTLFQRYDAMARQAGDQGAAVELSPIIGELQKVASSPAVQDMHPGLLSQIDSLVERLTARGKYSTTEAQEIVQNLNQALKSFHRNPTYETTTAAHLDALIVNKLREGLDQAIENAVAPGYQAIKSEYGALAGIEKDVVHRAIIEGRKTHGAGVFGPFGDIVSAEQVIHGIMSGSPTSIATGIATKGFVELRKFLHSPNRAVKRLFEAASAPTGTSSSIPAGIMGAAPGMGAFVGGGAAEAMGLQ